MYSSHCNFASIDSEFCPVCEELCVYGITKIIVDGKHVFTSLFQENIIYTINQIRITTS